MRTELISITINTLPLDGTFHLPATEPCGAVMLFHGNTMDFYVGAPRFLPPVLTRVGFACLAFNRCGHDILSIRHSRDARSLDHCGSFHCRSGGSGIFRITTPPEKKAIVSNKAKRSRGPWTMAGQTFFCSQELLAGRDALGLAAAPPSQVSKYTSR